MKLVVVSSVFIAAIGGLVLIAMTSSIPVLGLAALKSGQCAEGKKVQLDGGKIVNIESRVPLRFEVAKDEAATWRVQVESPRSPPENFKVGIPVSLRGTYDEASNTFHAYHITTQCPSRYEAADAYKKEQEKKQPSQLPGLVPEEPQSARYE